MKTNAKIVVGLGFGDEGKGLATDYLSNNCEKGLVVRFNGGHQAGHTVVTSKGQRHVFSNFGAGTLRGIPTYWSRYCTFSPAHFLEEYKDLTASPKILLDILSPLTTHYDILYNRALEETRGNTRLGSCGLGFGATISRHYESQIQFFATDLLSPAIYKRKLQKVRNYYRSRFHKNTKFIFDAFDHDAEDEAFAIRASEVGDLISQKVVTLVSEEDVFTGKNGYQTCIFEGSQGILLDNTFGNKPYVTKSNTTSRNAIDIINRNFNKSEIKVELFYVTRAYQTRHGNGPFKECVPPIQLRNAHTETNRYNSYQGDFRISHLNVSLLNYSLRCDSKFSSDIKKNLIITCLDQIDPKHINIFKDKEIVSLPFERIPSHLNSSFRSVKFSFSNCSEYLD